MFFSIFVSDLHSSLTSVQYHEFQPFPTSGEPSITNDWPIGTFDRTRRKCISRSCSLVVFFFFVTLGEEDLELVVRVNKGTLSVLSHTINKSEVITHQTICPFVSS
jgi:hypothetical protein